MFEVLLVEDHALVRAALHQLLRDSVGAHVTEAEDAAQALAAIRARRPDIVVLDLGLKQASGLGLLPALKQAGLRVLILSMHAEPLYARRALSAGALGYVSKNVAPPELIEAVRLVAAGRHYIEPHIAQALALGRISGNEKLAQLTNREFELLRLLGEGSSLTDIGLALGLSYKTVANNLSALRAKLGVSRTAELIRLALELPERGPDSG